MTRPKARPCIFSMNTTINSIPELEQFARGFLEKLPVNAAGATVVGLSGDLGSGKTAFVKAAARALGIKEMVLSPTFVLAKFYTIPERNSWSRLVHIDCYRIEDPDELKTVGWEKVMSDPRNLVLVEWPENAGETFPKNVPVLSFRFVDETTREIDASICSQP